jgi:hypothetical protein
VEDLETVYRVVNREENLLGAIRNLELKPPLILGLSLSSGPILRLASERPLDRVASNTAGVAPREPTPSPI